MLPVPGLLEVRYGMLCVQYKLGTADSQEERSKQLFITSLKQRLWGAFGQQTQRLLDYKTTKGMGVLLTSP